MLKSVTLWLSITVIAIGCTASSETTDDAAVPAYEEVVCHDARYKSVFDADEGACRAYLDSCLEKLTPAQRTSWDARVGQCIQATTSAECFAEVPWC
jgi:hypothetical protein